MLQVSHGQVIASLLLSVHSSTDSCLCSCVTGILRFILMPTGREPDDIGW